MSDGSSLTQISQCGSDQVGSVDSLGSTSSDTHSEESHRDCSDSESCCSTADRPSSVEIDDNDIKPPVVERIAKDTGCCLYSGITALVVMVVLLGIVLIVTGPVLGLSFPPLMRANPPPLPAVEDNHLLTNQSEMLNEEGHDYLDYPQFYQSGNESASHLEEFEVLDDYHEDGHDLSINSTLSSNETTEDLASLSPEALRLNPKYVAYVPIPIKDDDGEEDEEDHHEDSASVDRGDEEYDEVYDDESTPRSSSIRRRPEAKVDKVILPILMVPAGGSLSSGERVKTSQGSDSWRSNDFSDTPPRRFDEDDTVDDHYEDHLKPSSSLRIPGFGRFRNRGGNRKDQPIDYRMFGSLAPETRQYRPRFPVRNGPRDDYGRTTYLQQRRIPNRYRNQKGRIVEGREGPSLYIRPPPRPRNRNHQARIQAPHAWSAGHLERQRLIQPTRRPGYSYPKDAMSIQDIISYMTSLSHSSDETTKNPAGTDSGKVVWSSDSYHQPGSRSRAGQTWPNVLPAPPGLVADSRSDSTIQLSRNGAVNPYSFKLDVYPIRDGVSGSSSGSSNVDSFRQGTRGGNSNRYAPTSSQSYRQSQDYRAQYYTRQPTTSSSDSSASLADMIDYSYKVRIPDENKYSDSSSFRRPYEPNYRDEMPVPLAYRPRPSPVRDESTTSKPKLVVHLNVFNNKEAGNNYRHADDRHDDEEEDYYSPSDVYRAVLRNNAAKREHNHQAGGDDSRDDGMIGGQSRVSGYSHHITGTDSSSSKGQDNLYENHNMAALPTDHYYRSLRRPSTSTGTAGNYRLSHQSRTFYPADESPEPLPMPMPISDDHTSNSTSSAVPTESTLTAS